MKPERTVDIIDGLERRHLELLDQTRKLHGGRAPARHPCGIDVAKWVLIALVVATIAFAAIALALSGLPLPGRP